MSNAALIDRFLEMQAGERARARNTLLAYRRDLEDLCEICGDLETVDTDGLRAYLSGLKTRGMSAPTAARRLSAMRQFYLFLFEEGIRHDNPAGLLESPKAARKLPRFLDEAQVDALLSAASRAAPLS